MLALTLHAWPTWAGPEAARGLEPPILALYGGLAAFSFGLFYLLYLAAGYLYPRYRRASLPGKIIIGYLMMGGFVVTGGLALFVLLWFLA